MSGQTGQQVFGLPRLAGRLTAELILRSPQEMNAIKEYQIDLRGNKISAIENLGATQNQFDCIDLSDNEVVKLEGFPHLPRVRTLLLNNNRIARIAEDLQGIPNVETLVLTGNRLSNLADLDNLSTLRKLMRLSLLDNVVTKKENYRLYVIHRLPNLKLLDFSKVKQKEREAARLKFGELVAAPVAIEGKKAPAKTFEPGVLPVVQAEPKPVEVKKATGAPSAGPTPEQLTAIKAAIANATTLEEVARLEKALKSGHVAADILGNDTEEMEEG
mmetsp:Transcript_6212/g.8419  ORF Transcript_6212/g.8419 Transcript_6212/m.8419 type:complete len:273 (+) Transcript_6212:363-1181(+)|eukprot:CAMPEP_0196591764 /NCGR_PEP_ID=MMETSP1081-20130531/70810_1 /TAXON_ID=36882 /ORGANISM="Pyramimonas amylifera, Strain CCMP720" /LENGTH=272 /DNA_ID=CAMNT_0041915241 /DNA_START=362 /DNA_END=1180 /DNA_ORIENTATION=+